MSFIRRINDMENILKNESLENYFQLSKEFNLKVFPIIERKEIILIILYSSNDVLFQINELPFYINSLIHSYLYTKIKININLSFPSNYPFTAPLWSLESVKHNIQSMEIFDYIENLINIHNESYKKEWSPAFRIETDILIFMTKLSNLNILFN